MITNCYMLNLKLEALKMKLGSLIMGTICFGFDCFSFREDQGRFKNKKFGAGSFGNVKTISKIYGSKVSLAGVIWLSKDRQMNEGRFLFIDRMKWSAEVW